MSKYEVDYMNLVDRVLQEGEDRETRAGPTRSCFGTMLTIDCMEDGQFPILTTRKMHPAGVWGELAVFVRGFTMVRDFKLWGCNYWDANAAAWGPNKEQPAELMSIGPIYGKQWRDFNGVDQLTQLIDRLRTDPLSRRHVLTTLNPAEEGCLPPCHILAQFNVTNHGWLECMVTMRSVDLILGLPSDIILYATLQILLAHELGYEPGYLTFAMGDTHVYKNHIPLWNKQRLNKPLALPEYEMEENVYPMHFTPSQIWLNNYQHHEGLKYEFNA